MGAGVDEFVPDLADRVRRAHVHAEHNRQRGAGQERPGLLKPGGSQRVDVAKRRQRERVEAAAVVHEQDFSGRHSRRRLRPGPDIDDPICSAAHALTTTSTGIGEWLSMLQAWIYP
jgi:hypothetical protein